MFSLIVATVDRVAELERLLASLAAQTCQDFEVIVIDQNSDDRLAPVLSRFPSLRITRLHSERGLSRARNVGLRSATGDIIAIPDDDCWYAPQLLSTVKDWFDAHPEFDVLLGIMRNAEGKPMVPRFAPQAGACDRHNVWQCAVSNGLFMRRSVTEAVGFFNESIGVGAPTDFQSSEETEYCLRALACGFHIFYDSAIWVFHSDVNSSEWLSTRAYSYALGVGYVMRKQGFSWWYISGRLFRSFAAGILSLCKGDMARANASVLRGVGQVRGYLAGGSN